MKYLNSSNELHNSSVNFCNNHDCPFHLHSNIEIIYMESGELEADVNGNIYHLKSGDILLVFPFEVHKYRSGKSEGSHYCIAVNPERLSQYNLPLFGMTLKHHKLSGDEVSERIKAMLDLLLTADTDSHGLEISTALSIAFFGELSHRLNPTSRKQFNDKCDDIISACTELYTRSDFCIEHLANAVGISSRSLSRFFSEGMGITFSKFIASLRVDKAVDLMRTGKTVTESAMDSGFGSVRSFNRHFGEIMGCSPREYLKLWR